MAGFSQILSAYGFQDKQQFDVIRLLELAGCFNPERMDANLKELGWTALEIEKAKLVFSKAKTEGGLDPQIILSDFNGEDASLQPWPEKLHNWFIKVTQQDFFARKQGQERWQQETGLWMKTNEKEAREIIERLGLIAKVDPKLKHYNAVAVFGSTYPNMVKRLEYLQNWIDSKQKNEIRIDHVYLLGGERPADKVADGGEEFLQELAGRLNIPASEIMESHLIQEAYSKNKGSAAFSEIPVTLINAPRGKKPRPNTIDTLNSLSAVIDGGEVKTLFFVSRAPNIRAQEEDVRNVFATKFPELTIEVVGGGCDNTVALNQIMGAFGGTLFGGYIRVAHELGANQRDEELKGILQTLSFGATQKPAASPADRLATVQQQLASSSAATPDAGTTILPASLTLSFDSKVIPIGTVATTMPVNLEQKVESKEEEREKLTVGGGAFTN